MRLTFEQIETIYETANDEDIIEVVANDDGQIRCSITDEDNLTEILIIEKDGSVQ